MAINTLQSERLEEAGPPGFFALCTRLQADDPQVRTCVSAEPSDSSAPGCGFTAQRVCRSRGLQRPTQRLSRERRGPTSKPNHTHQFCILLFLLRTRLPPMPPLPCLPPVKLTASRKARGSDKRRGPAHLHVLAGFIAYNVTLWSFHS